MLLMANEVKVGYGTGLAKNSWHLIIEASSKLNCTFFDNSDNRDLVIVVEFSVSFHNQLNYYGMRGIRVVFHWICNKSELRVQSNWILFDISQVGVFASIKFVLTDFVIISPKLTSSQITRDVEGDCEPSPPLVDNKNRNYEMVILDLLMMWHWHVPEYQGPLLLTLIPAWISNYIPSKGRDEITFPFPMSTVPPLKFVNG